MTIGCGVDNESAVKIIGVYSPVGMCVKTGLAVNLSKKLGETNNVLYLNLSPFCGTELIEMLSGEKKSDEFAQKWSLSDVFYYAEQGVITGKYLQSQLQSVVELNCFCRWSLR